MKDALLTQAQKLEPPAETAIREFEVKWEQIAAKGTRLLMDRPDLAKLVGRGNEKMAEDNNRNFPRFMLSLFSYGHKIQLDFVESCTFLQSQLDFIRQIVHLYQFSEAWQYPVSM
ncbi:MAG: hypothetical protein K9K63_06555 [Desulfotignum sp.]|nr:hypothetical protein [Desulfotignum sp.]MCF8136954.1 hypothetical protein [Desulfotignum sp.]